MKKILLFILALLSTSFVFAENIHTTNTGTNTLTADQIKAKADAGTLYVAIQNHTTSANQYINKNGFMTNDFSASGETTWEVVPYDEGYVLKNIDGKYISGTSRPISLVTDIASANVYMPIKIDNDVINIASGYNTSTMAVRWALLPAKSNWINTNGATSSATIMHNSGTGNWTCMFTYEVTVSGSVNVTYVLMEGGEEVDRQVVEQPGNSAVSYPSSWDQTCYDYATTDVIGSSDCTVTVTRTVKNKVVEPVLVRRASVNVGESYAIFNTAVGGDNRYGFYNATSATALSSNQTRPFSFNASANLTNDAYWWVVEDAGDGLVYFKNASYGSYINGGSNNNLRTLVASSSEAKAWRVQPWMTSTVDKASVGSINYDGTTTANANITADNRVFTVDDPTVDSGNTRCWNGNNGGGSNAIALWASAHPFAFYQVEDVTMVFNTYILKESDGTTVEKKVVKQEANAPVAIPSEWTANFDYDYSVTGETGDDNATITVTRTYNDNTLTDINNLSNSKAYTLKTVRGALGVKNGKLYSTSKDGVEVGKFAIFSYESHLYLYSLDADAFIVKSGEEGVVSENPLNAVTFDQLTYAGSDNRFFGKMDEYGINVSENYETGMVINSWVDIDDGNVYAIRAVEDLTAEKVTAINDKLVNYFSTPSRLTNAINTLNAIQYGSGYCQYGFTGSYAEYKGQETTKIATILSNANTALTSGTTDEMEASITEINDVISNLALNLPANGSVFRLKSVHDTYMTNVAAIKEKTSYRNTLTADATDPNTIMFYVDGKIYCYGTGSEVMGSGSTFYTSVQSWEFLESSITPYKYAVRYTASGSNNIPETKYLFAWGPSSSYPNSMDHNSADAANCAFTIEAVENIPVEVSDALHATLYLPVGVQAVDGLTLNSVTSKGNDYLALNEVAKVAAKTPVIVKADAAGTYNLPVVNDGETVDGNLLTGVAFGGETIAPEVNAYILGQDEQGVGLFPLSSTGRTLASWKAYYVPAGETSARAFYFSDVTGLNKANLQNANEGVTYDLQGRRVQNAQKGLYIVNGKKVLVK